MYESIGSLLVDRLAKDYPFEMARMDYSLSGNRVNSATVHVHRPCQVSVRSLLMMRY